ncbi:hypothetical protein UVI_02051380 [Ustilaginoidea virens]|uniref:Uncharacterized protein n=1 Tax=Ustilaginoidea virens TaxID=1159556 RepID=A0A1B5KXU3_USTVR|nr:hypothetical protein UVI_02051380 [Ustilaginoidea virens]
MSAMHGGMARGKDSLEVMHQRSIDVVDAAVETELLDLAITGALGDSGERGVQRQSLAVLGKAVVPGEPLDFLRLLGLLFREAQAFQTGLGRDDGRVLCIRDRAARRGSREGQSGESRGDEHKLHDGG